MSDPKTKIRVILSDESVNSYGYRVLASGMDISRFEKNPVMLYMHIRDDDWHDVGEKAIGHWEDIKVEDGVLSAVPVFDEVDELSQTIKKKFDAGTYRAASIGFRVLATSGEKEFLLPGQTRETVTKSELLEASIVDIPANGNAVRLYDSHLATLAAGESLNVVPALTLSNKMNKHLTALLGFLGIKPESAESHELTAENLTVLNEGVAGLQSEHLALVNEKKKVDEALATANANIESLTQERDSAKAEVETLSKKAQENEEEISALKDEKAALEAQVAALKAQPTPSAQPAPQKEPAAEEKDDSFEAFCSEEHTSAEIQERLVAEGFCK